MSNLWNAKGLEYLKLISPEAGLAAKLERERIKHLIDKYTYKYNDAHILFLKKEKLMEDIEDGADYRKKA